MMPSAVLFIGIQAAGKSTFYARRFADTHVRINLDMLKTRLREARLIEACIAARQSFVVDNTNPSVRDRRRYFDFLNGKNFQVVGYYFQSKVSEALKRNARRAGNGRIPDLAIMGTSARLELPSLEEGLNELYYVRIIGNNEFSVESWNHEI